MKDDIKQCLDWLWATHRGCVIGAVVGAFLAICILIFGFFRTAFVMICVTVGIWLGLKVDSEDNEWLERLRDFNPAEDIHFKRKQGRP